MVVTCENCIQFMDVVESSVKKGLCFQANYNTLTIEYTGGY